MSGAVGRPDPEPAARSEHEALARLRALIPSPPPGEVWFGDDAAVVALPSTPAPGERAGLVTPPGPSRQVRSFFWPPIPWLRASTRTFRLPRWPTSGGKHGSQPERHRRHGRCPGHALVSVVGLGPDELGVLYEGVLEAATTYRCPVVGGDLSAGAEPVVTVALTGWVDGPPVLRTGARPGDTIWVSGPLGAAAAGLRLLRQSDAPARAGGSGWGTEERDLVRAHARPRPALAEGALARLAGATAMIDVSDGLVADLSQMAEVSAVGFELMDVPVAPGATLDEALGGGDDYVLAFTMPPRQGRGFVFGPVLRLSWASRAASGRQVPSRPCPTAPSWENAVGDRLGARALMPHCDGRNTKNGRFSL